MTSSRILTTCRFWVATACATLLSGCQGIILERAILDADLPLAPAAVMHDSSNIGDIAVQGALRVSDGTVWSDSIYDWNNGRLGGYGQVQVAINRTFRCFAGGGYSASPSYWAGASATTKVGTLLFDMDVVSGFTRQTHFLMGHEYDYSYDTPQSPIPDSLRLYDSGSRWTNWINIALRVRPTADNGPFAEIRILPGFGWGSLRHSSSSYVRQVSTSTTAASIGWLKHFENGSTVMVAPRGTLTGNQVTPDFQLTASLQTSLRL